jgi:fatty acid omega-hydroxylase
MNKYAYEVVRRRRQDAEVEGKGDILSLFLSRAETVAKDVDLTDEYLRDVVINFIIAGRDTTAQALSWSFYVMSTMPDIQQAVREEVLRVTDPLPEHEKFSYESIQQMRYTDAFLHEVLRLYPSVPKELKYAFEDSTLPDGTHIPKGGCVAFLPYVMGRHPALWEDPERFDPMRFYDKPKPSPFQFIGKCERYE